jgi:hypothetical protein
MEAKRTMSTSRRGGIPGPDRRTGLVRPSMTEAEFEGKAAPETDSEGISAQESAEPQGSAAAVAGSEQDTTGKGSSRTSRASTSRPRAAKPRRIQRMFAIEEDLDRKLWLYAIHMGKDRSEIVNDLLRPVVASMVVYDSRDRRGGSSVSGTSNLAESA